MDENKEVIKINVKNLNDGEPVFANGIKIPEGFDASNFPAGSAPEDIAPYPAPEQGMESKDSQHTHKDASKLVLGRLKRELQSEITQIEKEVSEVPAEEREGINPDNYKKRLQTIRSEGLVHEDEIEFERELEATTNDRLNSILASVFPENNQEESPAKKTVSRGVDRRGEYTLDDRKKYVDQTIDSRIEKLSRLVEDGNKKEFYATGQVSSEDIVAEKLSEEEKIELEMHIAKRNKDFLAAKKSAAKLFKSQAGEDLEKSLPASEDPAVEQASVADETKAEMPSNSDIWDAFKYMFIEGPSVGSLSEDEKKIANRLYKLGIIDKVREEFEVSVRNGNVPNLNKANLEGAVKKFVIKYCSSRENQKKVTNARGKKPMFDLMIRLAGSAAEDVGAVSLEEADIPMGDDGMTVEMDAQNAPETLASGENDQPQASEAPEIETRKDEYSNWTREDLIEAERNFTETASILAGNAEVVRVLEGKLIQIRKKIESIEGKDTEQESVARENRNEKTENSVFAEVEVQNSAVLAREAEEQEGAYDNWSREELLIARSSFQSALGIAENNPELAETLSKKISQISEKLKAIEDGADVRLSESESLTPEIAAAKAETVSANQEAERLVELARKELEESRREYVSEETKKRAEYGRILGFLHIKNSRDLENDPDVGYYREKYREKLEAFKRSRIDALSEDGVGEVHKEAVISQIDRQEKINLWRERNKVKAENIKVSVPEKFSASALSKRAVGLIKMVGVTGAFFLILSSDKGNMNDDKKEVEFSGEAGQSEALSAEEIDGISKIAATAEDEVVLRNHDRSEIDEKAIFIEKMEMGKDEYEKFKADFSVVTSNINKSIFNGNRRLFADMRDREIYGNEKGILEMLDDEGRASAEGFIKSNPPKKGETINKWVRRMALESLE